MTNTIDMATVNIGDLTFTKYIVNLYSMWV